MSHTSRIKSVDLTISKGIFRVIAFWMLALITILSVEDAFCATATKESRVESLSSEQRRVRLKHAHELLGRYYKKSSASVGEQIPKINSAVYHWTKEHLPSKYKSRSGKIAQAIIDVSLKHGFDPVFLMSVIEGESSWRPDKVGSVGEIGLMQLRPSTGKWMASRAGVKWNGDATLFDPVLNVKIGATYLNYLRERFDDHARLYLAAYNMGQSNVDSALDKKIWPKDYPIHVMKRYVAFYETVGDSKSAKSNHLAKVTRKDKTLATASKMTVVMKETPVSKRKRISHPETPTDEDDSYFNVDSLVTPQSAEKDAPPEAPSVQAVPSASRAEAKS